MPKGDNPKSKVGMGNRNVTRLRQAMKHGAKYAALGIPTNKWCELVGIDHKTAYQWMKRAEFQVMIQNEIDRHRELIEDILLEAEREAVGKLRELMNANEPIVAEGNVIGLRPAWDIRLKAVFRALDAAGRRGKPADVSEHKSLELVGDLNEMLANALRDPGVQEFLKEQKITLIPEVEAVEIPGPDKPKYISTVPPTQKQLDNRIKKGWLNGKPGADRSDPPQSGGSEGGPEEIRVLLPQAEGVLPADTGSDALGETA